MLSDVTPTQPPLVIWMLEFILADQLADLPLPGTDILWSR